jgi:hypothetical protein
VQGVGACLSAEVLQGGMKMESSTFSLPDCCNENARIDPRPCCWFMPKTRRACSIWIKCVKATKSRYESQADSSHLREGLLYWQRHKLLACRPAAAGCRRIFAANEFSLEQF